jgi:3'-phosphoadenosine 5'-phosphosulfate sulfotransferase (PAPS reductase)/FAD synthetase
VSKPMRTPEELLASGLKVIDRAEGCGAGPMLPLFSGGHDSTCACHVAMHHRKWKGVVNFINTGIGSKATHRHAYDTAKEHGWLIHEWKSPYTYERFVRERGFPGPGRHQWVYQRIKERCVRMMTKRRGRVALITGCRSQESTRRMGHVDPIQVGEWVTFKHKRTGQERRKRVNLSRVWTAPCHDWSSDEQVAYMDAFDLPRNPVKLALGMSGECFCGAFAAPGELERIRHHCPDVAEEIDRLTAIARECGTWDRWGQRPTKGEEAAESGPLCSSCDVRAKLAGVVFKDAARTS